MSKFTFRKADIKDAIELAELAYELNLFHGDDIKPEPEQFIKDWDRFEAFVVTADEVIIGFASGYDTYQFHTGTVRFEIQNLHVKEEFRGQGVAKKLFRNLILLKHKEGVRKFSLGVQSENKIARAFYESFGFEQRPHNNLRYAFGDEKLKKFIRDEKDKEY